jgi:hypothetical protein
MRLLFLENEVFAKPLLSFYQPAAMQHLLCLRPRLIASNEVFMIGYNDSGTY